MNQKTIRLNRIQLLGFLLAASCLFMNSCKKDTDTKTAIFKVQPELAFVAPNPPADPSSPANIPAMKILQDGRKDTLYLTLDRIAGFTYTEGVSYVLKVRITTLNNPPADGDLYSYRLIEQISKTK